MKIFACRILAILLASLAVAIEASAAGANDPLPSWNEVASKKAILDFVEAVTDRKGTDFVEPSERIAVLDNDGTLWVEKPIYTQLVFALDRVKTLAPQHPEWKTTQPFQAGLDDDKETLVGLGKKGLLELVMATHAGMTTAEFATLVKDWRRPILAFGRTPRVPAVRRRYADAPMDHRWRRQASRPDRSTRRRGTRVRVRPRESCWKTR